MKFELEAHVTYNVRVTDLEQVPAESNIWDGLILKAQPMGNPDLFEKGPDSTLTDAETAFEAEWLSEVVRTAIGMLPMHERLSVEPGEHFYLGHFNDPATPDAVAVLSKEMDNYGYTDITYNGWRVTVSCEEVSWGYEVP